MVGGLGGLGKSVARWMVERGARSFCFLSRSAGMSDQDQAFFKELESQGCSVATVAGSVAEMAHVEKAIEISPTPDCWCLATLHGLKGELFSPFTQF